MKKVAGIQIIPKIKHDLKLIKTNENTNLVRADQTEVNKLMDEFMIMMLSILNHCEMSISE